MIADAHQYRWQSMWLIIGPRLPQSEIKLCNDIYLAPLSEEFFQHIKEESTPVPKLAMSSDAFVVRYPPRDVVQSRYRLQVDIIESEQDRAIERATQIVDRLLASFSLTIPGSRYHAEMRKVRRADQTIEYSGWSQTANVAAHKPPRPFEPGDIDRALIFYKKIDTDKTAQNAYVHLLTAWQLQDTAGAKPLQRSVLQHYVLSMETITNGFMEGVRKNRNDSIRLEERKFAKQFSEELLKRSDKPEAIRQASTKLREIALVNMVPSIETIAPLLGLSDAMKERAKELYRFRSRSLSHPGGMREAEIADWLRSGPTIDTVCEADAIARAFLVGYCTHKLSKKI